MSDDSSQKRDMVCSVVFVVVSFGLIWLLFVAVQQQTHTVQRGVAETTMRSMTSKHHPAKSVKVVESGMIE